MFVRMLGRLDDAETTLQEILSRADDVLEKLRCFSLLISILRITGGL